MKNPDILSLCAKLKLALANLYLEFGQLVKFIMRSYKFGLSFDTALEIYDDLLLFIQKELTMRIHMKIYQKKRKNRVRLRKCVVISLIKAVDKNFRSKFWHAFW